MFKKPLVLISMLLGLNVLAALPPRLTGAQMSAIIRGDGKIQDEAHTWLLEKNFEEVDYSHHLDVHQVSENAILEHLNIPTTNAHLVRNALGSPTIKYIIPIEEGKEYRVHFTRQ